ncbi:NAD-dependent epimerase/dehydratase family protein [Prochlorococcus sp. MIT 0916]|uniref:NAD-dependent epimerase/dehydratase family protein n=1 Tax=Prochlorococcus sp. MIT 0916 TaxID=3082521 RepID=UPI0039B6A0AD
MKTAIITGASGFIGSALANYLLNKNYFVIAMGRCRFSEIKLSRLSKNKNLIYIDLNMEKISSLPFLIRKYPSINTFGATFYHLAWGGENQLSDFNIKSQLKNVYWAENALIAANELGCEKFIFVGTMEEVFAKQYLNLNYKNDLYYNRHLIYALAKTAARNMLKLKAKKYTTSVIFATNSHVMGPKDDRDSFLQGTLKKLVHNQELMLNSGELYFDVISSYDCARAYHLIGEKGKPFKEYWVGSGEPKLLKEYVEIMAQLYPSKYTLEFGKIAFNDISLKKSDFSINELTRDTGFKPIMSFEKTVHELYNSLFK